MRKYLYLFVILSFFLTGCVIVNLPRIEPLTEKAIGGEGRDKVLLLEISGVITDEPERRGFAAFETEANLTARIKESLTKAAKDDRVRAVVLRINSPGGAVTTCDIIAHEIAAFKKDKNVPVVAELMDLAASGGYYVASASDEIVAHPTTVTGSIGVIALNLDASGLLEKIGVSARAIKSGEKKDMGSPLRAMTDEEFAIFQTIIESMHERFIAVVREGRRDRITRKKLRELADGRVYSAPQALEYGLVDRIGYLDDAFERAKELAGIKEALYVTYAPPSAYRNNAYFAGSESGGASAGLPGPATVNLINIGPSALPLSPGMNFMYLWIP